MKKHILLVLFFLLAISGFRAGAQVAFEANIGVQPLWGPTGHDHVDYYYLPDIDAYYDVPNHQYVYFDGGRWITNVNLPTHDANYDLYHGYKVVLNEQQPWLHNDKYRRQYARYRNRHDQQVIRDSHDEKYWENPNHPQHKSWHNNPELHHFNDGAHGRN